MSEHVSLREFFDEKFYALNSKAEQIIELQKQTNGRVRAAEKSIAVLSVVYTIGAAVIGWIVYKLP